MATNQTIASIQAMIRLRKALRYQPVRELRVSRRNWRSLEREFNALTGCPKSNRVYSMNICGTEILIDEGKRK